MTLPMCSRNSNKQLSHCYADIANFGGSSPAKKMDPYVLAVSIFAVACLAVAGTAVALYLEVPFIFTQRNFPLQLSCVMSVCRACPGVSLFWEAAGLTLIVCLLKGVAVIHLIASVQPLWLHGHCLCMVWYQQVLESNRDMLQNV